jgi:hypothetical protein
MKCNRLFRRLRRLGVGKKILAWLFDRSRTIVLATLPSDEGSDAYIHESKRIMRLFLKGYTVLIVRSGAEKPSCYRDCPYVCRERRV